MLRLYDCISDDGGGEKQQKRMGKGGEKNAQIQKAQMNALHKLQSRHVLVLSKI